MILGDLVAAFFNHLTKARIVRLLNTMRCSIGTAKALTLHICFSCLNSHKYEPSEWWRAWKARYDGLEPRTIQSAQTLFSEFQPIQWEMPVIETNASPALCTYQRHWKASRDSNLRWLTFFPPKHAPEASSTKAVYSKIYNKKRRTLKC